MKFFEKVNPDDKSFIFLLALFTVLPPLAIDTYAPAIPNIAQYFGVSSSSVIFTYTTYFIGYTIGILLWGPLSDIYGRKKILKWGIIIYIISTILCSISNEFWQLSTSRILQGFGDSACATVAFAIARDCYEGKKLTKFLATLIMIFMIAPIAAPFIGLVIIETTHQWQYIFHFLTLYGLVLLIFSFKLPETIKVSHSIKLHQSFTKYFEHLCNFKFIVLVIASGFTFAAFFVFIGSSAVVYMKTFGTSKFEFSTLFALNVLAALLANYLLKKFCHSISNHVIIGITSILAFVFSITGFLLSYSLSGNIIFFVLFMWLVTFALSACLTSLTSEALNSIKHSFGVGTSINNATRFIFSAIILFLISHLNYKYMGYSLFLIQAILLFVLLIIVLVSLKMKLFHDK